MSMKVGVSNLHYAIQTSDTTADGSTYDEIVAIPGLSEASVKVESTTDTYHADNGSYETVTTITKITVELKIAELSFADRAVLFGHTVTGGKMSLNKDDTIPYVAIMFESIKNNGKKEYVKYYKGKFSEPSDEYKTKGENTTLQDITLTGEFISRLSDGEYGNRIDEESVDYVSATGANWYSLSSINTDTTAPTVTCVPADGATAVAVDADIVLTFSEAIAVSTLVVGSSLVIAKDDGTVVAGTGAWNTAHTVYTFTPTSNLSGNYNVNVTTAVKDLSGNALAAVNIFNFATV